MPLATLLPSAVWRGLVAAGSLLSQMPVLCHCLVAGLLAGQSDFGNFNFCILNLLVRLACRKKFAFFKVLAWPICPGSAGTLGQITSRKLEATGGLLVWVLAYSHDHLLLCVQSAVV